MNGHTHCDCSDCITSRPLNLFRIPADSPWFTRLWREHYRSETKFAAEHSIPIEHGGEA